MVRIRLKRMGRRRRPFYRIAAVDVATKRDGKVLEQLGWYDPIARDESKQIHLESDRIKHWLSVGAKPSETMMDILAKHGLVDAEAWRAERAARVARKQKLQGAAAEPAKAE